MYELEQQLREGKIGDGALVLEQLVNAPFDDYDCGVMTPHLVSLTNTPKLGASWSLTSTQSTPTSLPSPLSHAILWGNIHGGAKRKEK